ncbi:MAG: SGNH/GDSL hydrolase family protein [Proteobacteria bacterium]|nr:SGNH/GDSL hydrolase family protein [Pseudomonadota bacterium]
MKYIAVLMVLTLLRSVETYAEISKLENEYSILFIGNSLTYDNDVTSMVAAFYNASFEGKHMKVKMIAEGGYSLAQHLELPLVKQTIENNKYDAVVIQDFGGWPFCSTDIPACSQGSDSLKELIYVINESGAMPVWYSTYQPNPEVQKNLSKEVKSISEKLEVKLADVGANLQTYMIQNMNENIFTENYHLNYTGSLIAATTILQKILNKNISTDIVVGTICTKNWRGMNLRADKLASEQPSKKQLCKDLDRVNQNKIILSAQTAN